MFMKKVGVFLCAIMILLAASGCDPDNKKGTSSSFSQVTTETYSKHNFDNDYDLDDFQDDTKDWMKEQAEGKDYTTDDGGEYYCMGKNNTCPNKTRNAYDLYCSSCDPDGDNIEG